ncbi:MAG: hypothetical protein K0S65_2318, partial [Labilithrix sp.]|nr:hypothetical protein [Labilithrix sp.]
DGAVIDHEGLSGASKSSEIGFTRLQSFVDGGPGGVVGSLLEGGFVGRVPLEAEPASASVESCRPEPLL